MSTLGEDGRRETPSIWVVIPTFKARNSILKVINAIGPEVSKILVVDDACPEESGKHVLDNCSDPRVEVIFHKQNKGVGGSVCTGYGIAMEGGASFIVKLDSDGQMNPKQIYQLTRPVIEGRADYAKGNRFFNIGSLRVMPVQRLIGNAGLSFLSKMSSGYWSIFDPNNGFTAISAATLKSIDLDKIEERYFFESDMLFRLNLARAVVLDVPMDAIYKDEKSNLSEFRSVFEFSFKHTRNFSKRIFYNYFLREFSLATLNFSFGSILFFFGVCFGATSWINSFRTGVPTETSALILVAMSVLTGLQMLLSFLSYDISNEPKITKSGHWSI